MKNKLFTTLFLIITLSCYSNTYSQVTEEWVKRFNGPINGGDHSHAVTADQSGNVYITGWIETTTGNTDCMTIKYSPSGDTLWTNIYKGSASGIDYGYTITSDQNYVYVGGYGSSGAAVWDAFVLKYDFNGNLVWAKRYTSPITNYTSYIYSIAVDGSGNVYTTGFQSDGWSGGEFLTLKYNSNGDLQWAKTYKGPGTSIDYGNCVVVDNSGNVYITGWSGGENNLHDMTTIKYSPDGDSLWVKRYNGSANDNDYAYWLGLDAQGNVYVAGQSVETGSDNDVTTIKYSNSGDLLWIKHYNGPGNGYDAGLAIAVDAAGNSYVAGNHSTTGGLDCVTLKYDTNGNLVWVGSYNGPGNGGDVLLGAALDPDGDVYVTGFVAGSAASDYATIKYDRNTGTEEWVKLYNGSGNSYDGTYSIFVDQSFNVYVTGYSTGAGTDYDFATIKYTQDNVPVELTSFAAELNGSDIVLHWTTATELNNRGFEVERRRGTGDFYTIAFVKGTGTTTHQQNYNFTDKVPGEAKYYYRLKQIDFNGSYEYSDIVEVDVRPVEFNLAQNYPNPFNPNTTIKYSLPADGFVELSVYSVLGEKIITLINQNTKAGTYEVNFNAASAGLTSGIYFYKLSTAQSTVTKKMILSK